MRNLAEYGLVLIRHAPADHGGRLVGRTDVPALLPDDLVLHRARKALEGCRLVVSSPARRCVATAEALFPGRAIARDARLWEQDFGDRDNAPLSDLPDLGRLDRAALSRHRNPGGESFRDMARRMRPALESLAAETGPVAVIAHAGTIRAALGIALGQVEAGLAFAVAPFSATLLDCHGGEFAIAGTNLPLA